MKAMQAIGAALLCFLLCAVLAARAETAEEPEASETDAPCAVLLRETLEEAEEAGEAAKDGYRAEVPLSRELQAVLREECAALGIDTALALGLIDVESDFDAEAVSSCGCYGLMQLHPAYFPAELTPEENLRTGLRHLAALLTRCGGDAEAALTCYCYGHDNGERGYAWAVLSAAEAWREE